MIQSTRPTAVTVDLSAISENYRLIAEAARNKVVIPVVKADAYGHGMLPVAKRLSEEGCRHFAVSSLDEGLELRRSGIEGKIFLLFGLPPECAKMALECALTPTVLSLGQLAGFCDISKSFPKPLPIHLDIDTGMGRVGLVNEELERALALLKNSNLSLDGVTTHFARAGESPEFTSLQLQRFEEALGIIRGAGFNPGFVHASNSSASFTEQKALFDGVRTGIALYGGQPEPDLFRVEGLKPAMEWTTNVMLLREVPAGTPLSYGGTFVTQRNSLVATLPVGYADGYRRSLSNAGRVIVRGKFAPVVGRVCMDVTLVDVTDVPGVCEGDEVVLLGRRGDLCIWAEEIAKLCQTINYEIFCGIGKRVPRLYI